MSYVKFTACGEAGTAVLVWPPPRPECMPAVYARPVEVTAETASRSAVRKHHEGEVHNASVALRYNHNRQRRYRTDHNIAGCCVVVTSSVTGGKPATREMIVRR